MSVYELKWSRNIDAIVPQWEEWSHARQVVMENWVLIEKIFDYRRSHFTVSSNQAIFTDRPEGINFALLRRLCGLLDSETAHVSSLIAGFRIKSRGVTREVILNMDNIDDNPPKTFKLALLLYWLSEWSKNFKMHQINMSMNQIVYYFFIIWDFFDQEVTLDAYENQDSQYRDIRTFITTDRNTEVEIIRPWEKQFHEIEFVDDLDANYELLKKFYWLNSDKDVMKLLKWFIITRQVDISKIEWYSDLFDTQTVEVDETNLETALFLYGLVWFEDSVILNTERRKLVREYYGSTVCNDLEKYPYVQMFLQETPDANPTVSILKY